MQSQAHQAFRNLFAATEFLLKEWVYNKGGTLSTEEAHTLRSLAKDLQKAEKLVEDATGTIFATADFVYELGLLMRFFCVVRYFIASDSTRALLLTDIAVGSDYPQRQLLVETLNALSLLRGPLVLSLTGESRRLYASLNSQHTTKDMNSALIRFLFSTNWRQYVKSIENTKVLVRGDLVGSSKNS